MHMAVLCRTSHLVNAEIGLAPPYSTGFHSITVYGCAPPSNGTKHCDVHYSLENVQVLLRSSGKWLPLTLQTACSQQQALIVKKAIISMNSPDTISMPVTGLSRALLIYSYERTLWWSDIGKYWVQRSYLYLLQEFLSFWGLWEISWKVEALGFLSSLMLPREENQTVFLSQMLCWNTPIKAT